MNVEIINKEFNLSIYGFSGVAVNNNFAETGFKLMDKMWETVKTNKLPNRGINIWVYEPYKKMFAGVELYNNAPKETYLELKTIKLIKYAYYKHVGPYKYLPEVYSKINEELEKIGLQQCLPNLEVYGHWSNDESKLETEIFISLK